MIEMQLKNIIELRKAVLGYQENILLENVNFELAESEMAYLIGRSGSGKSTLIKTLYGEIPLQGGIGRIFDFDLSRLSKKEIPLLRRKIGMVFQDFFLFERWTVKKNLDYILQATEVRDARERSRRIKSVLDGIEMTHYLDTAIYELSGGEQQKIVIARAIINHPKIIIADEPTGNLDPQSSKEIMELLYQVALRDKTAILIATHDYELVNMFPARKFLCSNKKLSEISHLPE